MFPLNIYIYNYNDCMLVFWVNSNGKSSVSGGLNGKKYRSMEHTLRLFHIAKWKIINLIPLEALSLPLSFSLSLSIYIYTLYTVIGRNCTRMMASMRGIIPFYGLVSPLRGGRPKGRSVALFHLFSGPRSVNCYNYI